MSTLSRAVADLETRRDALNAEIAKLGERMRAIRSALNAELATAAAPAVTDAPRKRGRPAGVKRAGAGKAAGGAGRRWFAPGEVNVLMGKLIRTATRQRDVIKQLADAKGYTGKLDKQDKARFAWSVISSINAAVKAKRLIKRADGRLVASAALQSGR